MARKQVRSEIAGKVWKVEAKPGDRVADGAEIIILESMKMEIPVAVSSGGTIVEILVGEGDAVAENQVVAVLEG